MRRRDRDTSRRDDMTRGGEKKEEQENHLHDGEGSYVFQLSITSAGSWGVSLHPVGRGDGLPSGPAKRSFIIIWCNSLIRSVRTGHAREESRARTLSLNQAGEPDNPRGQVAGAWRGKDVREEEMCVRQCTRPASLDRIQLPH